MTTAISDPAQALLGVYRPAEPVFVAGQGSTLIAENGDRYLDFTSGIAVIILASQLHDLFGLTLTALAYLVTGAALGSFALGFDEDPQLYAERYPHLRDAHLLAEHRRSVDEGAFALGLETVLAGLDALKARLDSLKGSLT